MTEDEINAELSIVKTAITNLLKTGKKYELGSGASKRVFEMTDLKDLREYRTELNQQLKDVEGTSGMVLGF